MPAPIRTNLNLPGPGPLMGPNIEKREGVEVIVVVSFVPTDDLGMMGFFGV